MTKPRSHVLDVYDVHLHLVTDKRQMGQLRRKYPKIQKPDSLGAVDKFGHFGETGSEQMHIAFWIDVAGHRGHQGELLDTCAHEATHAACLILDSCAAEYDGSSEPLAYLVAWLTRWVWENL